MKCSTILALPVILAFSTLLLSCEKEKRAKEQLTTVNGNTFGALLNGKSYVPDYYDAANNVHAISIYFWYNSINSKVRLQLISRRKSGDFIEVHLTGPFTQGRRLLNVTTNPYPWNGTPPDYSRYTLLNPSKDFITNNLIGGYVDILKIDTVAQKIEARFEFTGTEPISGEQVNVTNGYFRNF